MPGGVPLPPCPPMPLPLRPASIAAVDGACWSFLWVHVKGENGKGGGGQELSEGSKMHPPSTAALQQCRPDSARATDRKQRPNVIDLQAWWHRCWPERTARTPHPWQKRPSGRKDAGNGSEGTATRYGTMKLVDGPLRAYLRGVWAWATKTAPRRAARPAEFSSVSCVSLPGTQGGL